MEAEILSVIEECAQMPFIVHHFSMDGLSTKVNLSKLTKLCQVSPILNTLYTWKISTCNSPLSTTRYKVIFT